MGQLLHLSYRIIQHDGNLRRLGGHLSPVPLEDGSRQTRASLHRICRGCMNAPGVPSANSFSRRAEAYVSSHGAVHRPCGEGPGREAEQTVGFTRLTRGGVRGVSRALASLPPCAPPLPWRVDNLRTSSFGPLPRKFSIMSRYKKVRPVAPAGDLAAADNEAAPSRSEQSPECSGESSFAQRADRERHRLNPVYGPGSITRGAVPLEAQFSSWEPPEQPDGGRARSLRVALIGPPNAGKSSLLNAILGQKLSAVSPKVNTTRGEIRGIVTRGDAQLVFLDAPGIVESHRNKMFCRELVSAAWRGYEDADIALLVIDTVKRPTQDVFNVVSTIAPIPSLVERAFGDSYSHDREASVATSPSAGGRAETRAAEGLLQHRTEGEGTDNASTDAKGIPVLLCLNKVDLASHPKWVYARAKEFQSHGRFDKIFHLSAKNSRGLQPLLDYLFSRARPGVWVYPPEMKTTLPRVQQVAELIKTYIFCWFNKDVPYRIQQQTIGWTHRLDGTLIIEQELLVKDEKVAKMVCGVRNRLLFQLRRNVSHNLEQNWGHKVLLYINVKALRQRAPSN
ncbi:GTPase [Besnoitia besnoiti]|uniref:GTPase n=1 Tax=Besnoitia besnoiti TaxID=94643 RepID=A0A2A9MEM0_BESBE|nr:GTPase [Besnoitia besnoiti]PFH34711.1 GTPase [Besnoitia besnoiti]